MKIYPAISPSLSGILSDDYLYFEGLSRPSEINIIRDAGSTQGNSVDVLEKYFNDVYNLFLRKLSAFAMFENTTSEDTLKLQALLQELVKVKELIEGVTSQQKKEINDKDLL